MCGRSRRFIVGKAHRIWRPRQTDLPIVVSDEACVTPPWPLVVRPCTTQSTMIYALILFGECLGHVPEYSGSAPSPPKTFHHAHLQGREAGFGKQWRGRKVFESLSDCSPPLPTLFACRVKLYARLRVPRLLYRFSTNVGGCSGMYCVVVFWTTPIQPCLLHLFLAMYESRSSRTSRMSTWWSSLAVRPPASAADVRHRFCRRHSPRGRSF